LAICAVLVADFTVEGWRYQRRITIPQPAAVSEFQVDAALYRNSGVALDDLRIVRDGSEVPYVILTLHAARQTLERPAVIINKTWLPGAGVQAVIDLAGHGEHNRLRIATRLHNFKEAVRVETSDDAHTWGIVQPSGLIFDVLRDDHAVAENTVSYPTSTRRFVRLTIPGWIDPTLLEGVWLWTFKEVNATRDTVASVMPVIREDAKAQTTELTIDLGFQGQPYDRISFTVDPGFFARAVEIVSGNDGQHWFSSYGGTIMRTAGEERLTLETPESADRFLRITVFNADSAPVRFGRVTLSGVRRMAKFASGQAGSYLLYFGNVGARRPSYDFASVMPTNVAPAVARLGAVEANRLFRPPERPWTDRNPWLLNGTLVVAVIGMIVMSLRMLRKIRSP
jgi:hypothetical protein